MYGRRGTGKTHLFLSLLAKYDPEEFEQHRTLAVAIDASKLTADTYGAAPLPQITALDLFGQVVKRFTSVTHEVLNKVPDSQSSVIRNPVTPARDEMASLSSSS